MIIHLILISLIASSVVTANSRCSYNPSSSLGVCEHHPEVSDDGLSCSDGTLEFLSEENERRTLDDSNTLECDKNNGVWKDLNSNRTITALCVQCSMFIIRTPIILGVILLIVAILIIVFFIRCRRRRDVKRYGCCGALLIFLHCRKRSKPERKVESKKKISETTKKEPSLMVQPPVPPTQVEKSERISICGAHVSLTKSIDGQSDMHSVIKGSTIKEPAKDNNIGQGQAQKSKVAQNQPSSELSIEMDKTQSFAKAVKTDKKLDKTGKTSNQVEESNPDDLLDKTGKTSDCVKDKSGMDKGELSVDDTPEETKSLDQTQQSALKRIKDHSNELDIGKTQDISEVDRSQVSKTDKSSG